MSRPNMIIETNADQLKVKVFDTRAAMGQQAALDVAGKMKQLLGSQPRLRMIFAAAPSQNEVLAGLAVMDGLDWSRVTVFHMDEYIGLSGDAPQAFGKFLKDRLFDRVQPDEVHIINSAGDIAQEAERYSRLLAEAPIDIVCLGIGENGHIAFNDPPFADFQDPLLVKPVELDLECRQQQVNDGCFAGLDQVPTHALTLTIPALSSGKHLFCSVPGPLKREAVKQTLHGPISTACPASILRQHDDCTLYADKDSYGV
ncbi:glucosamine-6-phosphate deaminase [Paenibacillus periandrae]|uniref:glucosamine-6-phosphate deaminase n=1 Tax=Paenibacillus periandrae TaxID=1761741 RepID=UPI001F09A9C2|nr:glucosamine-6-phosphate deaminase [Paenibacillus periandrae]